MRLRIVLAHHPGEAHSELRPHAALHQILLRAQKFGELGQQRRAAERAEQVRRVPDGRVGRDPGEAIGAAALEPDVQRGERRRRTHRAVRLGEPDEDGAQRGVHQRVDGAHTLLLEGEQRLGE